MKISWIIIGDHYIAATPFHDIITQDICSWPDAIEEWSEQNVMLCSQRQQRILADVMPALKNAGILIYSTCSYSEEEDEQIIEWARNKLTINYEELIVDPGWNIVKSGGGYRFWPDKIRGEGFFVSCLRKGSGDDKKRLVPKVKSDKFSKQEIEILNNYISSNKIAFVKNEGAIHALPEQLVPDVNFLSSKLRVMSFGTRVGEMIKDKLIPEHSLALSNILSRDFPKLELSYDQAIQYLKKKDPGLQTEKKGWWLASYNDYPLGWVNILSNRINNYYPKELRILKD